MTSPLHVPPGSARLRSAAAVALAALLAACASNPAVRRATTIADADRAAKAAVESENSLDAGRIPARTFAVLPFAVATRDTLIHPLGFGLADLLISDLSHTPELRLVERIHTDAILRELRMVDEGVTDPQQAPRVGRLVGARRILLGTASMSGATTMRLEARVVDVIAGTVQDVLSAEAPIDRVIDAEKQLALLIIERLGITLTPAQRARIEQRQTTQLTALVAYGRGVEAEARGDAVGATAAFEEAARFDAAFGAARLQSSGGGGSTTSRGGSAQRAISLTATAINAPVTTRTPEAADAPLAAGGGSELIFVIRITP